MNIVELSEATGVSQRNIKRYIHERILLPPEGKTRSARYSQVHRRDLLRIKALHLGGWTLDQIRAELRLSPTRHGEHESAVPAAVTEAPLVEHRDLIALGSYVVFTPQAPGDTEVRKMLVRRFRNLAESS